MECSADLVKTYQQALTKESGNVTSMHVIDKKTLARTGNAMEAKGLLKLYNVSLPLLNGNSQNKLLFLHPSMTSSSPQVKEYVARLKDKAILIGKSCKPTRIEDMNLEVEPLSEMQKPQSNEMWWLHTARNYGWINAKMIRAKILHQYLISKFNDESPNNTCINKINRTFQTIILLRDMPLDIYLKIIGQTIPSEPLTEYVCSGQSMSVSIIDLPNEIRSSIFSGNYKFRQSLKRLIDILVALKILKPIRRDFDENGNSILDVSNNESIEWSLSNATICSPPQTLLAPAYQLIYNVPMIDFSIPGVNRPIIRNYPLDTIEDVSIYWSELQYVAQQKIAEVAANKSDEEEDISETEDAGQEASEKNVQKKGKASSQNLEPDPLRFITSSCNWNSGYPLTARQKKHLDHYVDSKKSKTPFEDDVLCRQIAQESSLPFQRVKAYFRRIDESFEKKNKEAKAAKQRERRNKVAARSKNYVGIIASANGEPTFRRKRKVTNGNNKSGLKKSTNDYQNLGENKDVFQYDKTKKKKHQDKQDYNEEQGSATIADEDENNSQRRPVWSTQEDEILLYAYVILKIRSQKFRFLWGAVLKLFPEKTNEMCRRRVNVLMRNAATVEYINYLMSRWEKIYKEGVKKGEIIDPHHSEMIEFDLPEQVDYFIKALQNLSRNDEPIPIILLPSDIQTLYKHFVILYSSPTHNQDIYYEDKLSGSSLRKKMSILYSHSFTCRFNNQNSVDYFNIENLTEKDIKLEAIQALIKIILMTPEDQYDSSHAFSILNYYPEVLVTESLELIKDTGVIVRVKAGNDRRVPGRGYHVSDKFLSVISGSLPDRFFSQAIDFYRKFNDVILFERFSNSGTMASNPNDTLFTKCVIPDHRSRKIEPSRLHYDLFLKPNLNAFKERNNNKNIENKLIKNIYLVKDKDEALTILKTLLDCLDQESQEGVKDVFETILSSNQLGISLISLKEHLDIPNDDLLRYIGLLESQNPSLIMNVGFNNSRYVCTFYAKLWLVKTSRAPVSNPAKRVKYDYTITENALHVGTNSTTIQSTGTSGNRLETKYHQQDETYTLTRMWCDINGNFIESVFRGCLEASNIYRKLALVMSRCEIQDILDELTTRKAVMKTSFIKPPKVTLFSKPREFKNCGEQVGNLAVTTGRIITPSHLPETITLSVTNSSRFLILGTKPEILEWLKDNSSIKVDVVLYDDAKEAPHIHIPDLIIDLLPYIDTKGHEQHNNNLFNFILPTHHPDLNSDPVRLEIRAAVNLDETQPYFRIALQRNCTLGDILKEAKEKWDNTILPSLWDNVKKYCNNKLKEKNLK
ncbi:2839_t:CDS:10 [Entrophospora sp. SA101]|nr:2839_t:CDS:10 [Entrophospora sp. SA101]CAJ0829714.1 10829_t:CDS:10 [Entrophospora sp. SA101]CAJ0843459.1 10083_t:CDS:10 [Entrophospora sp. SA101]